MNIIKFIFNIRQKKLHKTLVEVQMLSSFTPSQSNVYFTLSSPVLDCKEEQETKSERIIKDMIL